MSKTLVAYFSASGNTKKKAEMIAEGLGAAGARVSTRCRCNCR